MAFPASDADKLTLTSRHDQGIRKTYLRAALHLAVDLAGALDARNAATRMPKKSPGTGPGLSFRRKSLTPKRERPAGVPALFW
jgi:hypothetical protein